MNPAQHDWVRKWWRALQPREAGSESLPATLVGMGRRERARLRRCGTADELLGEPSVLLLADQLIALGGEQWPLFKEAITYERLALVAGVLAKVKEDARDQRSLARRLGNGSGDERAAMSELRFKRLQRAEDIDDLFLQWRRAVQLAAGKVDVAQLADDLLTWQLELGQSATRASDGVKFRWAYDYYLSARDRAAADDPEPNKEPTP
ncbi:type I-E CRISPR-associated protein Cse2/CasB [Stutzerimonas stutzeri]|uniref:type I-E CRISPR-associated protein Cse2/CasB n=1 Tax=Stutzerimonas stutzeri TaxID=316 RepID=UPI0015E38E44|nr:type I-E CRISPR-associated protein Cse2/CasB [Stutzerimonas stutzeri]MBA1262331.1 type I-E CRISPR-associated protein Cse2/CasB [Stutzerimonas stutzeri]